MCFYHFSVKTQIRATRLVIFMTFWTTFVFVNILNLCPDALSELKKSPNLCCQGVQEKVLIPGSSPGLKLTLKHINVPIVQRITDMCLVNPLRPHDALKHHFKSLKTDLIFLKLGTFRMNISMKLIDQYLEIFSNF